MIRPPRPARAIPRLVATAGVLNGLGLCFAFAERLQAAIVAQAIATILVLTVIRHFARKEDRNA